MTSVARTSLHKPDVPATLRFAAIVTDIQLYSREAAGAVWRIALDCNSFSTGHTRGTLTATAASGAILVVEVEAVVREQQTTWLLTRKPLPVGTEVTVEIFGEPPSDC